MERENTMLNVMFLMVGIATFNKPACETTSPRLDGTRVTVCSGRVTRIEDNNGVVVTRIGSSIRVEDGRVWTLEVK
jgi:hypothetical protein